MAIEGIGARTKITVAAAVMALKAALGLWAAFALLTASASDERTFLGETITTRQTGLGLLVLALVVVTGIVIVQLLRFKRWARVAAIGLEVVAIVLVLTRIASATVPALASIVLSMAVITLLMGTRGITDKD